MRCGAAMLLLSLLIWVNSLPAVAADSDPVGIQALTKIDQTLPLIRPGVLAKQEGSWDRSGGNGDHSNFVSQQPDGTVVLFDQEGPGCIYRIWMTGINNNELKFYFDDENSPRIDTRLQDFFNGKCAGFPKPFVLNNVESSGGFACYVPIQFARKLKIVSNRKGIGSFYYNITYHRYIDRRDVESWRASSSSSAEIGVNRSITELWSGLRTIRNGTPERLRKEFRIGPGETAAVLSSKRSGIVRWLQLKGLPEDSAFWREVIIRVYYDNKDFPSIECPLGDFVGSPFVWSEVRSLFFDVDTTKRSIEFRWPLPFRQGIRITLTNEGKDPFVCIPGSMIDVQPIKALASMGYFHAQFRLVRTAAKDGKDLMILEREGRGHFVGCVQSVEGTHGLYFLEGDERVFVDDDKDTPSFNGTGTEDYYNGGWYFDRGPFTTATHGAPIRQNNGVISMYRLHPTDVIPFNRRIMFGIEHGHGNEAAEKYGVVSFWYQEELAPIKSELGTAQDRRFSGKILVPINREPGMMEAHRLKVIQKSEGLVHEVQGMGGFGNGWLGDDQLFIPKAEPGHRIVLELPVEKAGKYRLLMNFTKARDYGKWRVSIDDHKLTEIDLYNTEVIPTGDVDLGTMDLAAGIHMLTFECIGANDASVGVRFMFGLDYVWLKPA